MRELDVIIGGGEVGSTLYEILKRVIPVAVVDLDENKQCLPNTKEFVSLFRKKEEVRMLHICIPFTDQDKFIEITKQYINEYNPLVVVIHSTVKRGTTVKISKNTDTPVIFSATRGVHKRFLEDMEYYTKFWSTTSTDRKAINVFRQGMSDVGFKLKQMSTPDTLELAKLLTDTTYYGVLISYAQKTKVICDKYNVDYDEMWQFAEEGHVKIGNRPKMYPGYIGGHCVIQNLSLLDEEVYEEFKYIDEHNKFYKKWNENKDDTD
jgi:UDP-N-acetyl-D-mannosaminuronate dehydrogenase